LVNRQNRHNFALTQGHEPTIFHVPWHKCLSAWTSHVETRFREAGLLFEPARAQPH
jgi:hypothetical protein